MRSETEENSYIFNADLDQDEYFYTLKKRIYQSAREGYALNLMLFLNRVQISTVRNVLVNQVRKHVELC